MNEKMIQFCQTQLKSMTENDYGKSFREDLFSQYKIYIESLYHTGDLRQRLNSFFLTLNTLFLTALGASLYQGDGFLSGKALFAIPLTGILISFIWWAIAYSYKQRSIIKVQLIRCMEEHLPLAPFKTEWDVLKMKHGGYKFHFFKISLLIPWVFILLYALIIFLNVM